jgi:hypothetical protein
MVYECSFISLASIALLLTGCIVVLKLLFVRTGLKKICLDHSMPTAFDGSNSGNEVADGSEQHAQDDEMAQTIVKNFMYVHNRLLMASFDERQTPAIAKIISSLNYVVAPFAQSRAPDNNSLDENQLQETFFDPPNIEDVIGFDVMACALEAKCPTQKVVFHSSHDQRAQGTLAFLLGCHMMLSHGLGFEETYLAFRRLHSLMDPQSRDGPQISVKSCLRAFCRAKCSNWIIFKDLAASPSESNLSIHIRTYLHYARSFSIQVITCYRPMARSCARQAPRPAARAARPDSARAGQRACVGVCRLEGGREGGREGG